MPISNKLILLYQTLLDHYGPQHWWPGDTPFEIMVGAVLTQNTNWTNVEKAIANLKAADRLSVSGIDELSADSLAQLIRPAGYYNLKTRRLKNLIAWLCRHDAPLDTLADWPIDRLREELLSINGIGRETADSIILYALDKPTFVVDTYTYRILLRHNFIDPDSDYEQIKDFCESNLPDDPALYNECHALFVRVGKEHCRPHPRCPNCSLAHLSPHIEQPP